jgi:hypothetical protein
MINIQEERTTFFLYSIGAVVDLSPICKCLNMTPDCVFALDSVAVEFNFF